MFLKLPLRQSFVSYSHRPRARARRRRSPPADRADAEAATAETFRLRSGRRGRRDDHLASGSCVRLMEGPSRARGPTRVASSSASSGELGCRCESVLEVQNKWPAAPRPFGGPKIVDAINHLGRARESLTRSERRIRMRQPRASELAGASRFFNFNPAGRDAPPRPQANFLAAADSRIPSP